MTFAAPLRLFDLLLVPLAILGYWLLERWRAKLSTFWSKPAMLPNIVQRRPQRLGRTPLVLILFGLSFLLVGFARPQRVVSGALPQAPTIVLTFDASGSMAAVDAPPTRIRAARAVAVEFLHELPSKYRVAVVKFGNQVQEVVPPTLDRTSVLRGLPTSVIPNAGTGIGDAISRSVGVILNAVGGSDTETGSRPGAVVLLSDGAQTIGGTTPTDAALYALGDRIPVDTIGFGTAKGTVTQSVKITGGTTLVSLPAPVQTTTLQMIARQTSGVFFDGASVRDDAQPLKTIYEHLDSNTTRVRRTDELSAATAAIAVVLILAGIALSGLWFGRVA
jgi:Ca-activated chloride channel family protein